MTHLSHDLLCRLLSLQDINMGECPNIPSLQDINMGECPNIPSLQDINMGECPNIPSLQDNNIVLGTQRQQCSKALLIKIIGNFG